MFNEKEGFDPFFLYQSSSALSSSPLPPSGLGFGIAATPLVSLLNFIIPPVPLAS